MNAKNIKWGNKLIFPFSLVFFFNCQLAIQAQVLTGFVKDDIGHAIPYASVYLQKDPGTGTYADSEGKFKLDLKTNQSQDSLIITAVGFKKGSNYIPTLKNPKSILITLYPKNELLSTVEIKPGRNIAEDIIAKTFENRENANFNNINYTLLEHVKTIGTTSNVLESQEEKSVSDSLVFGEDSHFFITEAIVQRKVKSGKSRDSIIDYKYMGKFKEFLPALSDQSLKLDPYQTHLNILMINYLSPISKKSHKSYDFSLNDSLSTTGNSVCAISFHPKKGQAFSGLKGILYIDTLNYSITHFNVENAVQNEQRHFNVKGSFSKLGNIYIPDYQNVRMDFRGIISGSGDMTMAISYNTISFYPDISESPIVESKTSDSLWSQSEIFNTDFDRLTYSLYDSLDEKTRNLLEGSARVSSYLSIGRIPLGKINILTTHLIKFNRFEGLRLGLGLETSKKFSKFFSLSGYYAYGFHDALPKYGFGLHKNFNKEKDINFNLTYKNDLREPGKTSIDYLSQEYRTSLVYRNLFSEYMDGLEQYSASLFMRPGKETSISIFSNYSIVNPGIMVERAISDYIFADDQSYSLSSVGFNFRYSHKQDLIEFQDRMLEIPGSSPSITLNIEQTFKSRPLESDHSFLRLEVLAEHKILFRKKGYFKTYLGAGIVEGSGTPASFLYFGKGIKIEDVNVNLIAPGFFQTMELYEFLSDKYVQGNFYLNTGPLFSSAKGNFRPALTLSQSSYFGKSGKDYSTITRNQFKAPDKGFHECGLIVNGILSITSNLYDVNIDAGVFYRYGEYAFKNSQDNFTFALGMSVRL